MHFTRGRLVNDFLTGRLYSAEPTTTSVLPDRPRRLSSATAAFVFGSVAQPRFNALLLGIFAGFALLLTGVGLYGIVAYSVECRTREIGLRMALGAGRPDILRTIVWNGLYLTLIGMVIGLFGAFWSEDLH